MADTDLLDDVVAFDELERATGSLRETSPSVVREVLRPGRQAPDAIRTGPDEAQQDMATAREAAVELHWIPLGAGGHSVRFNGRVFEAIAAACARRPRCDLYHAALVIRLDGTRYMIEVAPSPDSDQTARGVIGTGAVGSHWLGWLRLFRYEVRCWPGGVIPDLAWAVGVPRRVTEDPEIAQRLLDVIVLVPRPVWGRDELAAGEMWNSNSVVAWLLTTAGVRVDDIELPPGGRAPGWNSGVAVARRQGPEIRTLPAPQRSVAGARE